MLLQHRISDDVITQVMTGRVRMLNRVVVWALVVAMVGGNATVVLAGTPPDTQPPPPCVPSPTQCCPSGNGPGTTGNPVRYFDGAIELAETDVSSPRTGGLSHTRRYFNKLSEDHAGPNGYNWIVSQLPYMSQVGTALVITIDPNNGYWFDPQSPSGFKIRHGVTGVSLTHDATNKLYTFTRTSGGAAETYVFHDFSVTNSSSAAPGKLKSHTDAGGVVTSVLSYVARSPSELQKAYVETIGGASTAVVESMLFAYHLSGTNKNRLQNVTFRRKVGTGAWADVRRASYTYYNGTEANGNKNDLKQVSHQEPDGAGGWLSVSMQHYRYYTTGEANGFARGLKYALGAEGYRRMINDGLDPLTATDAQLAPYTEHYFEYDTSRRVTKEIAAAGCGSCSGGADGTTGDTFTYVDATHGQGDGYNKWKVKTTLTHPDGNNTVVFTNYAGLVMLKVFEEVSSGRRWGQFYKYDADARVVLEAAASAVALPTSLGTIEAYADLLNATSGNYQYLADSAGLILVTDYYGTTDTATGTLKGYESFRKIKQGETGSEIKLSKTEYATHTAGGVTVNPVSKVIAYPDAASDATTITTSYGYEYHSGTVTMKRRTTTLPAVATGQNGSGTSDTMVEEFDEIGRPTWRRDERGFITRTVYAGSLGLATQSIQDVDTGQTADEPTGFSTPSGGGLHLVTETEYDAEGRLTQTLGPSHTAVVGGAATTVRTAAWTVYKETVKPTSGTWAEDETWRGQGYATGTSPSYTYALVDPVSIAKQDKKGQIVHAIASKRSTGSGKLASSDTFAQTDWKRWSRNTYLNNGRLCCARTYHAIPASGEGTEGTNYDERHVGYDDMGRTNRTESAGGTITRTLYDARGRSVSTWVGTDDAPDSGTWSPANTTGTNLVKISENEYDGNGIGDDNLTKTTAYATASDTRVTTYTYDWRNRLESSDGEIDVFAKNYYDNLNRLIKSERYDTTISGNLIARSETKYDDRGRVYQTITHAVDPSTGTVGNALTGNTWYNASGRVIKAISAGGGKRFTKMSYDGLGRPIKTYSGYDTAETSYADATTVAGDTILEQSEVSYDAVSNMRQTTRRSRLHDATGTGELTTVSGSQPKARASHSAAWHDGIRRLIASANYGTNGDATFSRPGTVPARSDTVLVSTMEYDDAGVAFKSIDPKNIETRISFDHAGRVTKATEAYDDGDPSTGNADHDRVTEYAFDADGQVKTITAKNGSTGDQVSKYIYGTTTTESGVARFDLLRAVIYPDSDDTEALANGTDGTYDRVELKYNRLGQVTERMDHLGTVHAFDFDKLGRPTHDRVTSFGLGVDSAFKRISRTYEVRGMLEKVTSYDHATVGSGSILNEVQEAYNTFGQLTTEHQQHDAAVNTSTSPKVQYGYADGGSSSNQIRPTTLTYPNARAITYDYGSSGGADDVLHRVNVIKEGGTSYAAYTYLGAGGVVRIDYGQPGVRLDLWGGTSGTYAALDRFGRVIDQKWATTGGTVRDQFQYGYDRNSNRTSRDNTQTTGLDELYGYDNLNRLTAMDRGTISGGAIASPAKEQDWTLDPTGNWSGFITKTSGTTDLNQSRAHNEANEVGTISETTGPSWVDPAHDLAGNMTTLPKPDAPTGSFTGVYDAWNRLVELKDGSSTVARYEHDARGRRIIKEMYTAGSLSETRHFYHSNGWQVLEERVGTATTAERQYVWGARYVDELVCRDRDTNADTTLDERLYTLQDANFNVTAVADTSGAVVERYSYTPYGTRSIHDGSFGSRATSSYTWDIGHQGLMHDGESGLVYNRNRVYHPTLGRFVQRDPIAWLEERSFAEQVLLRQSIVLNFLLIDRFGSTTLYSRSFSPETPSTPFMNTNPFKASAGEIKRRFRDRDRVEKVIPVTLTLSNGSSVYISAADQEAFSRGDGVRFPIIPTLLVAEYSYESSNPIVRVDPSGLCCACCSCPLDLDDGLLVSFCRLSINRAVCLASSCMAISFYGTEYRYCDWD